MAVELIPNEGKQYIGLNPISGRTVYAGVIYGQTVAAATITATSTLATLQEDLSVPRVPVVLGAMNASGIIAVPGFSLVAIAGGNASGKAVFVASAASGGVAVFVWDLSSTRDMSLAGNSINVPALSMFFKNPGE